MASNPRVGAAILGFAATVVLVNLDAAPFVEGADRLPIGIGGLVLVGAAAGYLANDRRIWSGLVAGVLGAAVLHLVGRVLFNFLTGPSLTPVDAWRAWLFLGLGATVALVSIGLAIGRLARGWRPGGALAAAVRSGALVATASIFVSAAIAGVFATTRLVMPADARILTVRVSDTAIELSPSVVGEGMYHVVVDASAVSRPRWLSLVSANEAGYRPIPAEEPPTAGGLVGLSRADADAWFDGRWLVESPEPPPRYALTGGWEAEPGREREYGGELHFSLAGEGRSLVWYLSAPGQTTASSRGEEVAWPPEARAILTIGAPGG